MKFKEFTFHNLLHDSVHNEIFKTLTEKTTEIENEGGKVHFFSHSITNTIREQDGILRENFKGSLIISYQE